MTVRELISLLEDLDGDQEVVFCGANSGGYVDEPTEINTAEVRKFWGKDTEAVVIYGEQIGMA